MSLSTTQYGYIVDPMVPFTDDKGKTIKNGFIRVFMAGTSTPVLTYRNYDGATNQEKIELDNSGRVKHNVIGSKGSLYKVVVYDAHHSQETPLLTVDKIAVLGASINATGATIVTGLDSVTVQEENFLKATVEGTGVELSLDPTEVTSEVSTIGAAETAATDYVVPLLEKTGTEDSKKISLANLFKFALDWISRLATTITSFASGDFIAVSNTTNGARKMSKDTLLELTAQNALGSIKNLPTKYKGFMALDDADGTGKFPIDNLIGSIAEIYVAGTTNAIAGKPYMYQGKCWLCKENTSGDWDGSKFEYLPFSTYSKKYSDRLVYLSAFVNNYCLYNAINKIALGVETDKALTNQGVTASSVGYRTTDYIASEGNISYSSNKSMRCVCFYGEEKVYLGSSTFLANVTSFTAPEKTKFIRISYSDSNWSAAMFAPTSCLPSSYIEFGKVSFNYNKVNKDSFFDDIVGLADIRQMDFVSYNLFDKDSEGVDEDNVLTSAGILSPSDNYNTSDYIEVDYAVEYSSNKSMRVVCFYDSNKTPLDSSTCIGPVTSFDVPSTAKFVRISYSKSNWDMAMFAPTDNLPAGYIPYGKTIIDEQYLPDSVKSKKAFAGFRKTSDNLPVNTSLSVFGDGEKLHCDRDVLIMAQIRGTIESVSIGFAYLGGYGKWLEVTPTRAIIKYGNGGYIVANYEHHLTLDNMLNVSIDRRMNSDGTTTTLRLVTEHSEVWTMDASQYWSNATPGDVFVRNGNDSDAITCDLSFMPKDITRDIWVFGDSYMNYGSDMRWTYYLFNAGKYNTLLLNARGGENSTEALVDFKTLVNNSNGVPSYAIWGLGMNDGTDSGSQPNSTWLAKIQDFLSICDGKGIAPILMTIPSVPSIDNSYKNAWVKASGRRYIDVAEAVEKEGTNTWKFYGEATAYLHSDNVHPTEYGARAIYERVLIDFPEISVN